MANGELKSYLLRLVERTGTYSYEFDLELTRFFEQHQRVKNEELMRTIGQLLNENSTDAAFACLYLFSIYLKHSDNTDGLETVLGRYGKYFPEEDYPLILELNSRCLKRRKNDPESWRKALECDKKALHLLRGVFFAESTYGVNASYVSTLCRILEYGAKNPSATDGIKEYVSEDDCGVGIECIKENILNNPGYAKYHYLKAQLMYYRTVVFEKAPEGAAEVTERCEECDGMIAEISEAIEKERVIKKRDTYAAFAERISAYQSELASSVAGEMYRLIDSSSSFENCVSPMCHAGYSGKKYAFICYCRGNYKDVFKDIYTLYCKNTAVKYDRIVNAGSRWTTTVEEAILDKDCAVVIFYMSEKALESDSIFKEISIVTDVAETKRKKYFFISVDGSTVSELIYNTYRTHDYDPMFKTRLTPDRLVRLLSFFNDTIHFLSRGENDYERKLAADINRFLAGDARASGSGCKSRIGGEVSVNTFTSQNGRSFDGVRKPNEDILVCDAENAVFIVSDGVTRPHAEYGREGKSSAYEVAGTFCRTAYEVLTEGLDSCKSGQDVEKLLTSAFERGNAEVGLINDTDTLYKPATVSLAAVIFGGKLYFAYIGDCIGILIRGRCRYVFAERQTVAAGKLASGKEDLYKNYVNNRGGKHAYGVINGDPLARYFVVTSHFELEDGDKIIISTDGLTDALMYEPTDLLASRGLCSMIGSASEEYDRPPFSPYADDKAMIDITFSKNVR